MAFYNTYVNYNGNGATTTFSVPFSYLDQDEVVVTFAGPGSYTYVFTSPNVITVSPALAVGASVRIERITDLATAKVVYSNGAPVTGGQLNSTVNQLLYGMQEANDVAGRALSPDAAGVWDAENARIKNLATPTLATDAATKAYVDAAAVLPGPTGATGPQGPVGPAGATGNTGPQGPIGLTGPQGPQGPTGSQGPQGTQGPQGLQGPAGSTGATGPQGPAGVAGSTGPAGPTGAQGVAGPTGPSGADFQPDAVGLFANRSTYNTQSTGFSYLATDQEQLYFKLSATSGDWSNGITFGVGPQGPAGPQGPTGPQGAQGPQGSTGPQGPTGATGATGPQGPAGPQGVQGPQGVAGANGAKGNTWRGAYSAGTTYVIDDVVEYNGSAWIAILGGTGNAPPTAPATSNTYWNLFVSGTINSSVVDVTDTFSGTGSQTAFTLSLSPAVADPVNVFIDGVYQQSSKYSISGSTLTFTTAPPAGTSNIQVRILSIAGVTVGVPTNSVGTTNILNGAVTEAKIADGSITTAKLAAGAVDTVDIADSAVTSAKIADGTIATGDIADGAITSAKIADATITGTDIANTTIAVGKLSATGTPSATTYLRGDNSWATPAGGTINVQTFPSSGVWNKPAGYSASSRVLIQAWGGGGSGGKNNGMGGGGGGYNERWLNLSQMGATETITIGAGGVARTTNGSGNVGGTTSIGSLVYAYGGGGGAGVGTSGAFGGGGGGQLSAGSTGIGTGGPTSPGKPFVMVDYDTSGIRYCQGSATDSNNGLCDALFHGGGGAGQTVALAGNSVWGGGGGGGCFTSTAAGTSQYAGNGGAGGSSATSGTSGTAPSGGGGGTNTGATSGAGAAGQVIITVFPA